MWRWVQIHLKKLLMCANTCWCMLNLLIRKDTWKYTLRLEADKPAQASRHSWFYYTLNKVCHPRWCSTSCLAASRHAVIKLSMYLVTSMYRAGSLHTKSHNHVNTGKHTQIMQHQPAYEAARNLMYSLWYQGLRNYHVCMCWHLRICNDSACVDLYWELSVYPHVFESRVCNFTCVCIMCQNFSSCYIEWSITFTVVQKA